MSSYAGAPVTPPYYSVLFSSSHSLQCEMIVFMCLSISYLSTQSAWHSQVVLVVKNPPANAGHVSRQEYWSGLSSSPWQSSLEQNMTTYFSIPAWIIPWTEKPGGLQSMGCKESDVTEHTHTPLPTPQDLKQPWHEMGIQCMLNE